MTSVVCTPFKIIGVGEGKTISVTVGMGVIVGTGVDDAVGGASDVGLANPAAVWRAANDLTTVAPGLLLMLDWALSGVTEGAGGNEGAGITRVGKGWLGSHEVLNKASPRNNIAQNAPARPFLNTICGPDNP